MTGPIRFIGWRPGAPTRPPFGAVMMTVAHLMATRSTCPRQATGAVLCSGDWEILATGYNGAPSGQPHCTQAGCDMLNGSCVRTVHAEMNAILQAARSGPPLREGFLFSTHRPCIRCANAVARAGIIRVSYVSEYATDSRDRVEEILGRAGTILAKVEYSPVSPVALNSV